MLMKMRAGAGWQSAAEAPVRLASARSESSSDIAADKRPNPSPGSVYFGACSAVDKLGQPLPVAVVGQVTFSVTLDRLGLVRLVSCSYADGSGATCASSCGDGVFQVQGLPYCTRHAAVAEAIAVLRGTVFEIWPPPCVDDRGFNLLLALLRECGPRVTALLHSRFKQACASVLADRHPRRIRNGTADQWEQGWWVTTDRPIARIALRASACSLPEVAVTVDGIERRRLVPDWRATRLPKGRVALLGQVVGAVRNAVDERDKEEWFSGSEPYAV